MSKHGTTHLSNHPEVDYAIVLDGGQVVAYFRNTTRKLIPNIDAFESLFGKLEEYKPGKAIPHRPKTAFPVDVSISDQAYALLVKETAAAAALGAPVPAPPSVDARLDDALRALSGLPPEQREDAMKRATERADAATRERLGMPPEGPPVPPEDETPTPPEGTPPAEKPPTKPEKDDARSGRRS